MNQCGYISYKKMAIFFSAGACMMWGFLLFYINPEQVNEKISLIDKLILFLPLVAAAIALPLFYFKKWHNDDIKHNELLNYIDKKSKENGGKLSTKDAIDILSALPPI